MRAQKWICNRMSPSNDNGCFVSVRSFGISFCSTLCLLLSGIIAEHIRTVLAFAPRKHGAVSLKAVGVPFAF